jgi:hypothetical protein
VDSEGDVAPRVGFVHNFKKSECVVKKWDSATEDISTTGAHFYFINRAELGMPMKQCTGNSVPSTLAEVRSCELARIVCAFVICPVSLCFLDCAS